jgi:hypothetical protein
VSCKWCGREDCVLPNLKSLTFRCVDLTRVQQEERDGIIDWLRYLSTANKDPAARRELDRVLRLAPSTVDALRVAIEANDMRVG